MLPYCSCHGAWSAFGKWWRWVFILVKNKKFIADKVLYVGLHGLHSYQKAFLDEAGVGYEVQSDKFISNEKNRKFHSKIWLNSCSFWYRCAWWKFFHSTYFADPEAGGDGSGGGKMKFDQLSEILALISQKSDVVSFSIAKYLPFDAYKIYQMFNRVKIFTEGMANLYFFDFKIYLSF